MGLGLDSNKHMWWMEKLKLLTSLNLATSFHTNQSPMFVKWKGEEHFSLLLLLHFSTPRQVSCARSVGRGLLAAPLERLPVVVRPPDRLLEVVLGAGIEDIMKQSYLVHDVQYFWDTATLLTVASYYPILSVQGKYVNTIISP